MGMGIIFLLWIVLASLSLRWAKIFSFKWFIAYISIWVLLNTLILLGFVGYFIYYILNHTL